MGYSETEEEEELIFIGDLQNGDAVKVDTRFCSNVTCLSSHPNFFFFYKWKILNSGPSTYNFFKCTTQLNTPPSCFSGHPSALFIRYYYRTGIGA